MTPQILKTTLDELCSPINSRILHFCGYDAFKIELGSQLNIVWEYFHSENSIIIDFPSTKKQINGILFLETSSPYIATIKGLCDKTDKNPAVGNTGPCPLGRAQEGQEKYSTERQGSLRSKEASQDMKNVFTFLSKTDGKEIGR